MTSWRDSVPTAAQDELDALVGAALELAEESLLKRGAFAPFGVQARDGDMVLFHADPGFGDHPPSTQLLRALVDAARADRDEFSAVALASDVTLAEGGDAVRVHLEHCEGIALDIHLPYRRRRFGGKVTFAAMTAGTGDRLVWDS